VFTEIKNVLRDWVESRISASAGSRVNDELRAAGLFCEKSEEQNLLGYVGPVRIEDAVVITSIGIQCGYDESAYLYELGKRIWQYEQTAYEEGKYHPHDIVKVETWKPHVLVVGNGSWCSSNWRNVHYSVWRLGMAKAIINEVALAFEPELIRGAIRDNDVLIEYHAASMDMGIHNREAIRHYRIVGSTVLRDEPVALSPRDFVDEWLTQPWTESTAWSRAALKPRHAKLQKESVREFIEPTLHCAAPDQWQVGVDFDGRPAYFRVRWRPPYRFTMLDVSEKPAPDCTERDPFADERRTLFP
jgi:hypothetical protein